MSFREYKDTVGNKSVYPDDYIEEIFNKEQNVYLIELIYDGYFGTGNNVNLDKLKENGLWDTNVHPYFSNLSRDQVLKLFNLGKVDV